MIGSTRKRLIVAGVVVVLLSAAISLWFSRPKVTGDSPSERVDSICKIADEAAIGAGDVIAKAATAEQDPTVRQAALVSLGKFPSPSNRNVLTAAMREQDPAIRSAGAIGMRGYKDDDTARQLEAMLSDTDRQVRAAAIGSLEQNLSPAATVALVEAIESNPDPATQKRALVAIFTRKGVTRNDGTFDPVVGKSQWLDEVEIIKAWPEVKAAYAQQGRQLVTHPQNKLPTPKDH